MIPTLLPFMILSGIMIRLQLTEGFTTLVYPIVKLVFRVSRNVCYAMFMGFLCGFPMGAKTISDLYTRQMITKREAEFLLAFCNNIGPVYFIGFVIPLLQRKLLVPYLVGMYGIPLVYGIILRYTAYRNLSHAAASSILPFPTQKKHSEVSIAEYAAVKEKQSDSKSFQLLNVVDESITSSLQSILNLMGYMILFNLLNLIPHILLGKQPLILAPLFEISGGLTMLQQNAPLYTLLLLPFGGLSCIAQTNNCICNTDLSIAGYTFHKMILTILTAIYYLLWYWLFPASFLC